MCTRYTLSARPEEIAQLFKLAEIHDFPPRYNIAPEQPVGIVRIGYQGLPEFALVRWGLLPGWVKDPQEFALLVNARSETLLEKPSFVSAVKYRRCLFPMSGYYFWTGEAGGKQAFHVSARGSKVFAVAGLWETWMGADGSEIDTGAIITVDTRRATAELGSRMPAIVARIDWDNWLDCRAGEARPALRLLRPAPDDLLQAIPVGTAVNNPRNDGPELVQRTDGTRPH